MKKRIFAIATVLAAFLLLAGMHVPADAAVGIRGPESDDGGKSFEVSFEPVKPVFAVGEQIRFRIKGNKTFYLYLFSVDHDRDEGYMLLPNVKQQYNKYEAGKTYDVPEKYIEFFADAPGTERVIMLASTKKLDVEMSDLAAKGQLFSGSAGRIEEKAKALRVRSRENRAEQVTKEFSLIIAGEGREEGRDRREGRGPLEGISGGEPGVSTFLSTNRTEYRAGDTIVITYGADRRGFVHLYSVEPDGKRVFLATRPVSGEKFYQLKARAMPPGGGHQLVAVYDEDETPDEGAAKALPAGEQTKDIRLIGDGPESYAVYHLHVYE